MKESQSLHSCLWIMEFFNDPGYPPSLRAIEALRQKLYIYTIDPATKRRVQKEK